MQQKKIDGKEHNTANGVSIATEFNNFKDVLFKKILLDIKWKEFKVININEEHMKLMKYLYHVLTIKGRYVLDDGIQTLSYFHKNSVKSCIN